MQKWFQVARHDKSYTVFSHRSICTYGLVIRARSMCLAKWVQFQQDAETLCSLFAIFSDAQPVSGFTHLLLYCCSLYNFFP